MDKESEDLVTTIGELINVLGDYDENLQLADSYVVSLYNALLVAEELECKPHLTTKAL